MKVKLKNYLGNQTQLTLKAEGDYVTPDREVLLEDGIEYQLKLESSQLKLYQGSTLIGNMIHSKSIPINLVIFYLLISVSTKDFSNLLVKP